MLSAGTRLGPYEIQTPLGAGGMGEVYRARDSRLGREVAIKVLPPGVSSDADRLARFEQEARAASALNHPNIVTVHDVGASDGTSYLALELVSGQNLRDVLAAGALAPRRALQIAAQIAEGLAAAHARGIVHRDLKPENVMLTNDGVVKILDFGLAKLAPSFDADASVAETAPPMTVSGTVLGTVGYMSPEQATGRPADFRSDQFSFGAILYELLTGRRAFSGTSAAETLAAVIRDEPEALSAVDPRIPAPIRWAVERCLAKDPDERFASTRDLARDLATLRDKLRELGSGLSAAGEAAPAPRPRRRLRAASLIAAVVVVAAAFFAVLRSRGTPPDLGAIRFSVPPPERGSFSSSVETTTLAVSPDGTHLAFISTASARTGPTPTGNAEGGALRRIWVRALSDLDARPVAGTEDAASLFWSPNSRSIGFFKPAELKRVDAAGGPVVKICDVPTGSGRSATWGAGDDILFADVQGATIMRVNAAGGTPETVLSGDASRGETRLLWPAFLPDGKTFLYVVRRRDRTRMLMMKRPGGAPRALGPTESFAHYVEPGYVVLVRGGALLAQRFDAKSGSLGEPLPIAEHVRGFPTSSHADFAASPSGVIAYQAHESVSRLVYVDMAGREVESVGKPADLYNLKFARGGRRVYYDKVEAGNYDVYSFDLDRGVETRVTSSPDTEVAGLELPDGSIVYGATRIGQPQLYRFDPVSGKEERLVPGEATFQWPEDLSPDGKTLLYTERTSTTPFRVWALSLSPPGPPRPLVTSSSNSCVRFSPDGRYVSFISNESGRPEAYVTPYPGPGERTRVSADGARLAQWSRDGRRLFYLSLDNRIVAVPVSTATALELGASQALFRLAGKGWMSFDVTPDGSRFLAIVPEVIADEQPLTVIVGWRPPTS